MRFARFRPAAILLSFGLLGACATPAPEGQLIADPYEQTNRAVFGFNKGVDTVVLRPVAIAYDAVTPALGRHLIGNAVQHVRLPGVFINNLLQGEATEAGRTLARFAFNTLLGAGGLLNPAAELGLPFKPTDFGATLAKAGVAEGPYLMAPVFGPYTGRHLAGSIVDLALDPFSYINLPIPARVARTALPVVEARAANFEQIDDVLYESPDPYITARSTYVQARRALVSGGRSGVETAPDIYAVE